MKNKMKIKMNFCFCFRFCFCFSFLKVFIILLTPRGLEVPQAVNCYLIGLEVPQRFCGVEVSVPQMVNSLLIGLEVPQHLEIWHLWLKKSQNYDFKLKFGCWPNSNMHNSMMLFIFFVFDRKSSFWANLVQIVNIVILR